MTKSQLLILSAIAVALAMAPAASAHLTLTAVAPTEPVQVGVPFVIPVTANNNCVIVLAEYQAMGETELYFGLPPEHPNYYNATSGIAPWTIEQCSTNPADQGAARSTADLTMTVGPDAPGLVPLNLTIVAYGDDPSTPEGGDPAIVQITIAHYANGSLQAMAASGMGDMMANESGHDGHANMSGNASMSKEIPIMLHFTYTTNAESLLTFEVTSSVGEVHEIDAIAVTPPSFDNKSEVMVMAMADFVPPASWETADLTFTAYLTPVVGGPRLEVASDSLTLTKPHSDAGHDDEHGEDHNHSEDESSIPSPAFAIVGLGLLAFAAVRRR